MLDVSCEVLHWNFFFVWSATVRLLTMFYLGKLIIIIVMIFN